MSRPTEFFKEDELVYWDISIYDADGTALDADSNPTVEFRVHGNDTLKTGGVTVTKLAGTTGLYRVAHNLASDSDLSIGASVRYQETATIAGVDYVNRWSTIIRAEPAYKTTQDDMEDVIGDIDVATTTIESKTSQLTFTIANQVDANSLTGGTSPSAVADAVWDEAASGHNVGGSFGKFIRQMKEGLIVQESTVNDASATTTSFVSALPSAVDDYYNDDTLVFISGSLVGQSRIINDYNGTTKAVSFDEAFTSAPANSDEFILLAGHNLTLTQIENQVWNAVEANHQITGSTGKALTDASATGGDATAANQNTIIAKLTTPAVVYTNPSSPNKLTLIRGDAYDDANENNGKLTWNTGKTLTGASVRFTIRDASDNILIDQTTAGVSTSVNSQTAEVSLTSAATALLTVATTNKFDAEAYWSDTNRWTFARGSCTVLEDQTRT